MIMKNVDRSPFVSGAKFHVSLVSVTSCLLKHILPASLYRFAPIHSRRINPSAAPLRPTTRAHRLQVVVPAAEMDGPTPRQSTATFVTTHTVSSTRRPSTPSTSASRSSTTTLPNDVRRLQRPREKQFTMRNGHKHHTYDAEKAPYPVSYDRRVLEL